jgi:hypothetical protein
MALNAAPKTLNAPVNTPVMDDSGKLSQPWDAFFKDIQDRLNSLGYERAFKLTNNQAVAADIDGMVFDKRAVSQVAIDYLIQRVTTSTGATELIETGTFFLAYKPNSSSWVLTGGPTTSGVTLTVTSDGQVKNTTTNITGTPSISKITWRPRILEAKHSSYSEMGR